VLPFQPKLDLSTSTNCRQQDTAGQRIACHAQKAFHSDVGDEASATMQHMPAEHAALSLCASFIPCRLLLLIRQVEKGLSALCV
jgi:hypothetical protein